MTDTQETPEVEGKTEEKEEEQKGLAELLSEFPDAPEEEQIEGWKTSHGEVFCSGFSAIELYIFRPLNRREFVQQQLELAQAQATDQFTSEEETVNKCLLWKSGPGAKALENKAGSLSTLHEQIMQNSNFVNPAMASALVVKL